MGKEMMYGEAIATAIIEEMQRDPNVVFYGQNMGMTERDPMLKMFGKDRIRITPISETAELGIAVGAAMTGLRPIVELWMSEIHAGGIRPGSERSAAAPLHVRRAGESPGCVQGRLRICRRVGGAALQLHVSPGNGDARFEGGYAFDGGGCERPDEGRDS